MSERGQRFWNKNGGFLRAGRKVSPTYTRHLLYLLLGFSLCLGACTRSTIPIDATVTYAQPPTLPPDPGSTPAGDSIYPASGTYSVVWIAEGEKLKLRVPAGIAGSVVNQLEYDTRGVRITGNTTNLGSSLWVEIEGPDGELGWVNSWNLTEEVSEQDFCVDPRILGLLEKATLALLNESSAGLQSLVNPKRGLVLRHDWWNPEVIIRPDEIPNLYLSRMDRDWGFLRGGEFAIQGSFNEVFSPPLLDVLSKTPTAVCGDIPSGATSLQVVWPGEYANMHFYAFHRPSPEGGNRFDWRTVAMGFEYIQGEPYLTLLVLYQGDI